MNFEGNSGKETLDLNRKQLF